MTYIANCATSFLFGSWRPKCLQLSYSEREKILNLMLHFQGVWTKKIYKNKYKNSAKHFLTEATTERKAKKSGTEQEWEEVFCCILLCGRSSAPPLALIPAKLLLLSKPLGFRATSTGNCVLQHD